MGWMDRIVGLFRRTSYDPEPDAPEAPPTPAPTPVVTRPTPAREPVARAEEPPAAEAPPAPPRPARAGGKKRKARKGTAVAPSAPRAEVLSVEEAERRYGELVRPASAPGSGPSSEPEPATEPPPPLPQRADRRAAAREEREATLASRRGAAQGTRLESLLSRTDALLAVAAARPSDLASARRELVEGFRRAGALPEAEAERLGRARQDRLDALDARIAAAAAGAAELHATHLAARRAVVEEARALAEREDLRGAGPAMGELRKKLRAQGPCAPEDQEAVARDFAAAEERLAARQREQREGREAAREQALHRLAQLVDQAEALTRAPDPELAAQRAIALQATWKTVRVPGPRDATDAAWTRFRAACDEVFAARARARTEAGETALRQLEDLAARAEQLAEDAEGTDLEPRIDALLAAWKKVGRAPRDRQQALWERFAAALDRARTSSVDLSGLDGSRLSFRPFDALKKD